MKLEVFTIFDRAVNAFMQPFFVRSQGEAMRMLSDSVADPTHLFSKHPADYRLYHLGGYNDHNGGFTLNDAPEFICSVEEVARQMNLPIEAPKVVPLGRVASLAEGAA